MFGKTLGVMQPTRRAITLSCIYLASLVASTNTYAASVIKPNDSLVLYSIDMPNPPDGTGEECFKFLLATCQTDRTGDRIGARTAGTLPFERAKATVYTYYDFDVDNSDGAFDTVLNAQISGVGEFNGFLALVAGGSASGSLNVTLIDLGPSDLAGVVDGQVVLQRSLARHLLQGTITTGINFGITVEGGAPYIGMGASPELKFNVKLQKKVIRDGINFGIQALVKRGHRYRVLFEVSSTAKRGATTGTAISQFKLGGPVTDILDTENWLTGIRETISAELPNLKPESMRIKEGLGWFGNKRMIQAELVDSSTGDSVTLSGTAQLIRERAAAAGLPTSFADIVAKRFRQRIPDAVEEGIDRPGFRLTELSVMLEPDQVEIAADQADRINEAIRLLLTPQGQRSSTFIECDNAPGNSGSNGNGNGPGNNGDCDFPNHPSDNNADSSAAQTEGTPGAPSTTSNAPVNSGSPQQQAMTSGGGGAIAWIGLLGMLLLVGRRLGLTMQEPHQQD